MHTVTERVYRDKDGKPTTNPEKAVSLLYAEGMEITDEQAAEAGLVGGSPKRAAKDVEAPAQTKDVKGPKGRK